MSKFERHDIALQNHTEAEIAAVEKEMLKIRIERVKSSKDPVVEAESDRFATVKDSTLHKVDKKKIAEELQQHSTPPQGRKKTNQTKGLFSRFRR